MRPLRCEIRQLICLKVSLRENLDHLRCLASANQWRCADFGNDGQGIGAVKGHETRIVGPEEGKSFTFAISFYPEIKLEFLAHRRLRRVLGEFHDFIHITTEGPLGWAARRVCLHRNLSFSTAYHTRFPEYLAARTPRVLASIVRAVAYVVLRRFHAPASVIMVATEFIQQELKTRKFRRLVRWSRGVDTNLFRPYGKDLSDFSTLPRPILLYVGRVAVEKNFASFWISTLPEARSSSAAALIWRL